MSHTENGGSVTTGRCLERMESLETALRGEMDTKLAKQQIGVVQLGSKIDQVDEKLSSMRWLIGALIAVLGLLLGAIGYIRIFG